MAAWLALKVKRENKRPKLPRPQHDISQFSMKQHGKITRYCCCNANAVRIVLVIILK
jgi:hypothetical protein